MTLYEKYSDKVRELLQDNPKLTGPALAKLCKYRGNLGSWRNEVAGTVRKELGIRGIKARLTNHKSADEILSSRPEFDRFGQFNEYGLAFGDGFYIDNSPYQLTPGRKILVIGDQHIGVHLGRLCMYPLEYATGKDFDTIIINGDLLDFASVSAHAKSPYERMTLKGEIDEAYQYLSIMRRMFPKAEIIYAEGNHEYRLGRFIAGKAKELDGIVFLEKLLKLEQLGITFVPYHKHVRCGDLDIMHGHHLPGSGKNVAGTLLEKAMCNIMFNDRHTSQEAFRRGLNGRTIGAWAVGCLCPLTASYCLNPLQWINGFAEVHSNSDGTFTVKNWKIIDWKLY